MLIEKKKKKTKHIRVTKANPSTKIKINDILVYEIAIHHDIPFHGHPNKESAMVAPPKFQ